MRADLHLHSVFSDGSHTPAELARMAKAAGLGLFSVTDHDNLGGAEEGAAAARALGLRYVRGWEVSSYEGSAKVHVLGYGCRTDEHYAEFLRERVKGGRLRAEKMLALANDFFGLSLTLDDVEAYHARKDTPLHTMHVVTAYAEKLGREKGELYAEAFAFGGPAYAAECRPTPLEAVEVIHKTGGLAVLAHPGRIYCLTPSEYREAREAGGARRAALYADSELRRDAILARLTEAGLDGIECYYTTHTVKETQAFSAYAHEHGLFITGGSDFHADGGRQILGMPVFQADAALTERLLGLEGSV